MSNKNTRGKAAKKNSFKTTVHIGTRPDGSKKTKTIYASSQKELDRKVAEAKALRDSGKDMMTKAYFGAWAEKWYKDLKEPSNISASALTVIQGTIKHLNRYFEKTELKDITLAMFQGMINDYAEENPSTHKPMSVDLMKKIKSNAKAIFDYAALNNIAYVPTFLNYPNSIMIPKGKAETTSRRALTEDEQKMIIETDHKAQLPAMIMLFSGLRRGECLALEWSDIDFDKSLIHVTKSLEFGKNQSTIKAGGKTKNAVREVPIPSILRDYLKSYKDSCKTISKLVCTNVSGQQYTKSSWSNVWESYLLDLNIKYGFKKDYKKHDPTLKASELPMRIEPFTPHYLRHTFATMLILQNVDVVRAMTILGHADIQTTVNIYTDFKSLNDASISDDYKHHLATDYKIKTA